MVAGEEEAAEAEGGDGDGGADPARVGLGGVGEAEAEVDCVACEEAALVSRFSLRGGALGVVVGGVVELPVCRLTKLPHTWTLLLSSRPVMM